MSAIEKELVKATGIEPKKGEDRQDYLFRLAKATAGLSDKEWEALSEAAQEWYNKNTDARNTAKKADKELPDFKEFPDSKKEDDEQPRRRRSDDDDEPVKKKGGKATGGPDLLKEGLVCEVETKKGKVYTGEVTELNEKKGFVVLKTGKGKDDEIEVDLDKIATVSHDAPAEEETSSRRKKDDDGDDADPIKKGAKVKVVTKRGKEFEGTITELTEDELVLKTDDGEEELRRDRIETIKLLGGGKKDDDKPSRSSKKDEEDAPRSRAKNKEGVSVGARIREIIAEAKCDISMEAVGKILKKEEIEFKDNTLSLNYAEVMKTVAALKEAKLLKI